MLKPSAEFPETILSKVASNIRFRVAEQALAKDKAGIEKLLSKLPIYKQWGSKSRPKQIQILANHCEFDLPIANKVLQVWVSRSEELKNQVWEDLVAAGYTPAMPDFQNKEAELPFESLRQEDVFTDEDQQYFAPGGSIREGVQREFYTLMAHVLGWSVLEASLDDSEEYTTDIEEDTSTEEQTLELIPDETPVATSVFDSDNKDSDNKNAESVEAAIHQENHEKLTSQEGNFLSTAELQDSAARLLQDMKELAIQFELTAAELKQGIWPLHNVHEIEINLRSTALELGSQIGLKSTTSELLIIPSVEQILGRLKVLVAEQDEQKQIQLKQQKALELLLTLSGVGHKTVTDFAPLQAIHAQCRDLQAELTESTQVLAQSAIGLLDGSHPLAKFLELVPQYAAYAELREDDERVHEAEELLEDLGGAELRRAWQRGNLSLGATKPGAPPKEPETPSHADTDTISEPEPIEQSSVSEANLTNHDAQFVSEQLIPEEIQATVENDFVFEEQNHSLEEEFLSQESPDLIVTPKEVTDLEIQAEKGEAAEVVDAQHDHEETVSKGDETASTGSVEAISGQKTIDEAATIARPTTEIIGQRQWALLRQNDAELAFQLARCAEELGWYTAEMLPSWLLRSLILGPHVRNAYGRVAGILSDDVIAFDQKQLVDAYEEQEGSRHLLAWAAALRPTLVAPATTLNGWLSIGGVPGLPLANALANRLAQRQSGHSLDESLLGAVQSQQEWDVRLDEWQTRLNDWVVQQDQAKFLQSPTNDIVKFWKSCRQEGRIIARVIAGLQTAEPAHKELLAQLNGLRERSGLRDEVKRSKIDFSVHIQNNTLAQRWLEERVSGLADLVRQHQELWEQQPARAGHKDVRHDDRELLKFLHNQLPLVAEELAEAEAQYSDVAELNLTWLEAIRRFKNAVIQLHDWFQHPVQGEVEALPRYLLGSPMLRIASVELNMDWEPKAYDLPLWEQLWQLAQYDGAADWSLIYEAASQASSDNPGADHQATARLLALAEVASDPSLGITVDLGRDLQSLRFERAASLRQQPVELNRELDKVERELVRGQRYGYLNAEVYERIQNTVGQLRRINESHSDQSEDLIFNYRAHHQVVRRLWSELAVIQKKAIEIRTTEVEQEVQGLAITPSPEDLSKLQQVLHDGRLALVEDYLARLRAGRDLGPYGARAEAPSIVKLRYRLQQLNKVQQQSEAAVGKLLKQSTILDDGQHHEGAATAYEHWIEVKRSKTLATQESRKSLQRLLEYIGFDLDGIEAATATDRSNRYQYLDLHTVTLNERRLCPVSRFGSEAEGHYRVINLWETLDPADLSSLVAKYSNADKAVLVFVWDVLPWKQREELGLHCRREGLKFLVFDELLLLYLLTYGSQSERLGLFFRLQLPFIHLNPYLVSGKIPSEMFYGRVIEKTALVSHQTDGANFIYGGRQLGKTMLLHQAVREYHQPANERYVLFLDIYHLGRDTKKLERIGYELLQLFRAKKIGNWPASWSENTSLSKVLDQLLIWIEADSKRTLSILLDETDEFLEQDAANNFALVNEFRRVIEKSERRIKFVFSGLHNVQRTLNLPNQPLIQFGKPLNIGPLKSEQGIDLIKTPLESLGFCFGAVDSSDEYRASEALIDQIAVETNYYPSLMQIFCHRLLERLYERQKRLPNLLTYISEDDVQQASQNARSDINNRFGLTLDLNPRYRLLAYIIAEFTAQTTGTFTPNTGLLVEDIRDNALEYWQEGWKARSDSSYFTALLEEMVELRVLEKSIARTGQANYRLRTANVRALLDSPEDIRRILADFDSESAEFTPSIVRAELPTSSKKAHQFTFRAPFTVAEVLSLEEAGVSVVCGTNAAGMADVTTFLAKRFRNNFEKLEDINQFGPLEEKLKELWADKKAESVQIVLVTGACKSKWIEQALNELNGKTRKRPVRVIFEMTPVALQNALTEENSLEKLQGKGASLLLLRPWPSTAIKLWLEKEEQTQIGWKKLGDVTGGWHQLLKVFFELESKERLPETHIQQLEQAIQEGSFNEAFHISMVRPFLRALAREWKTKPFDLEDAQLNDSENLSPDDLRRELKWAEMLGLIKADKQDLFRFDSLVAKVLHHGA